MFIAPQNITTGTASPTQFSTTVNLNAGANAALNNLQNPLITLRQFRTGQGPIYNIANYSNGAATLTLDRPYLEATSTGQSYSVYRCYYTPTDMNGNLVTDFQKFKAILNPIDGYAIVGENLNISRQELDARDPTRGSQDLAYVVAAYNVDANGNPIYEFWPHPTSSKGYVCLYTRRGLDLSNSADAPNTISKNMIVERGRYYAYAWAIANVGRFPSLKGVDWRLIMAESQRTYDKMLLQAKVKDDDIFADNYLPNLRDYMGYPPIDSRFWQSHDVSGWFEG